MYANARLVKFIGVAALCCVSTFAGATPAIQHWQSASGAKVLFVENHDLPMLDVAVTLRAGSSFDAPDKSGVAGLTHQLLDAGAGGLSEDQISRGMADVGAQFGGDFNPDSASVSLRTLSSATERDKALDIMARVLQHPEFPEAILEREKVRLIASLKEAETQPESIAEKAFQKAVYGTHPYALPATGEVGTVGKITVQDLRDFYQTHYQADHAVVAIMGDATRAEAEAIARQLTAQLPKSPAPAALPRVEMKIAASELRIPHPASQSHILIGAPGVARGDPDYFPLFVGNYVLGGGGFESRLMNEVREKGGWHTASTVISCRSSSPAPSRSACKPGKTRLTKRCNWCAKRWRTSSPTARPNRNCSLPNRTLSAAFRCASTATARYSAT